MLLIVLYICSIDYKTFFCTRCLTHFNHERFLKQHADKCPNIVKEGNLIDSLNSTGGYSKEIKRRYVNKTINLAKLFEAEMSATKNNVTFKTEDC